jgi:acyl carrier protein
MLVKSNLKNQTKRIFNVLTKKFASISLKNKFNSNNLFSIKNNNLFLINRRYFSTDNKISEKESIDLVESKVFEVLKRGQKIKHEKLSRTATLEELGLDSLDIVENIIAFEEEFQIEITGINLLFF